MDTASSPKKKKRKDSGFADNTADCQIQDNVQVKEEPVEEIDVTSNSEETERDESHQLKVQNCELKLKIKRLKNQLKLAKEEAEERQLLSKMSKEKLVDLIIQAKYHNERL